MCEWIYTSARVWLNKKKKWIIIIRFLFFQSLSSRRTTTTGPRDNGEASPGIYYVYTHVYRGRGARIPTRIAVPYSRACSIGAELGLHNIIIHRYIHALRFFTVFDSDSIKNDFELLYCDDILWRAAAAAAAVAVEYIIARGTTPATSEAATACTAVETIAFQCIILADCPLTILQHKKFKYNEHVEILRVFSRFATL